MKIYIKNMVCDRCILVVKSILTKLNIPYKTIGLGSIELSEQLSPIVLQSLAERLESVGFELIDNRRSILIDQIKTIIIEVVYNRISIKVNLSNYISDQLNLDYNYISNLFSEVEQTTIEKFYINQKIERIKELLEYDEMSLSEIAFELNYSSTAHLSSQFKKKVGKSPSEFKKAVGKKRSPIDKL